MKLQLIIITLFVSSLSFAHNTTNFQQTAQASLNFPKDTNYLNDAKILFQQDVSIDSFRLSPLLGIDTVCSVYSVIAYISNAGTDTIKDSIKVVYEIFPFGVNFKYCHTILAPNQIDSVFIPERDYWVYADFTGAVRLVLDVDPNLNNNIIYHNYFFKTTGLSNANSNSIYLDSPQPNPANNQVNIPFSVISESDMEFTLLNAEGRLIYQKQSHYIPGGHNLKFNVSDYAEGIYFYSFKIGSEIRGGKLIIKH